MEKLTFASLFQRKTWQRFPPSPRQLERRLRLHFASGCVAGGSLVACIYNLVIDWEKGHLGAGSLLWIAGMGLLFWSLCDSAREDLRQMTHFKLKEAENESAATKTNIPSTQ
ncbi:hypothetical protein IAD21_04201 [Abditibacteriota bacterium]|nr:hypothetical protein IAD21_04201 [Abditibacteriota bacterium]